jgi:hypothetical protein
MFRRGKKIITKTFVLGTILLKFSIFWFGINSIIGSYSGSLFLK